MVCAIQFIPSGPVEEPGEHQSVWMVRERGGRGAPERPVHLQLHLRHHGRRARFGNFDIFGAISQAFPCLPDAGWRLQFDVLTNPRLQAPERCCCY